MCMHFCVPSCLEKKDIYQKKKTKSFLKGQYQKEISDEKTIKKCASQCWHHHVNCDANTVLTCLQWSIWMGFCYRNRIGMRRKLCAGTLSDNDGRVSVMTPSSSTNHKNFSRPISLELIFKEFYLYSLSSTWLFWWLIPKSMKSFHIKKRKVLYEFILRLYIQSLWVKLLSLSQINSMGSLYA